jgi:hypothetical protein
MPRGRPPQSQIRQNIIEILHYLDQGYGYQICKIYHQLFPSVTRRCIYYHLRKGVQTEEIKVSQIQQEKGDFSWGSQVEKTYYTLGKMAKPKGDLRVQEFLKRMGK